MNRSKRKAEAQIIDEEAIRILHSRLPKQWTLRQYNNPDFGIDFAIELFEPAPNAPGKFDTLGEHLFVQLKGKKRVDTTKAGAKVRFGRAKSSKTIVFEEEVIHLQMDTPELVTVQRMGPVVPVLLLVAETTTDRVFFVCLNDYIDKVLAEVDSAYSNAGKKNIYIPLTNEISKDSGSLLPIMHYAKRAKLYSGFLQCEYQNHQLSYVSDQDLLNVAKSYAEILLRYDFWESSIWFLLSHFQGALRNFLETGVPGTMKYDVDAIRQAQERKGEFWESEFTRPGETSTLDEIFRFQEIRTLWANLANLSRVYEEMCRAWFLPAYEIA